MRYYSKIVKLECGVMIKPNLNECDFVLTVYIRLPLSLATN